jgi:hypothetical protein
MQYVAFIIVTFLMNLLFWYYIIVFCIVYPSSAKGLLYSFLQGLILDWLIFEFIRPVGSVVIRMLSKKFTKLAYIIINFQVFDVYGKISLLSCSSYLWINTD